MKKDIFVMNVLPFLIWVLFFRFGGNVSFCMLPMQAVIIVLNCVFVKTIKNILIFNSTLLLSSVLGIIANSSLYFSMIYYDSEGELVMMAELFSVAIYILFLTGIAILIKYIKNRSKEKGIEND